MNYNLGCQLPIQDWVKLNRVECFNSGVLMKHVAPLPPVCLMENVSGLKNDQHFASHGADIFIALTDASPVPLHHYKSILDFGCGCGRFARMLKGHPGKVSGCDIDKRHVEWINHNLHYMEAKLSTVHPPIPFEDGEFEAVVSISIFTHLNEKSQDEFLAELSRICKLGGTLFLTVHGERALNRAKEETPIWEMLSIDQEQFDNAYEQFVNGEHAFIRQNGHLTTVDSCNDPGKVISELFEYGITFTPESYIRSRWTNWFDVIDIISGGIHNFQDIIVLTPRSKS